MKNIVILGKPLPNLILEIVILVTGILLAFFLNNWWLSRQEGVLEQEIKNNLKEEFEFNLYGIQESRVYLEKAMKCNFGLMEMFNQEITKENEDLFDSLLYHTMITPDFNPTTSAFLEIVNSGKLTLLKSKKLRKDLSEWHKILEQEEDRFQANSTMLELITTEYLYDHISFIRLDKRFGILKDTFVDIPEIDHEKNILKNRTFINFIEDQYYNLYETSVIFDMIDDKINKLLLQLEDS